MFTLKFLAAMVDNILKKSFVCYKTTLNESESEWKNSQPANYQQAQDYEEEYNEAESSISTDKHFDIPMINLRCDGDGKSKNFVVKCRKCPEVSVYNVS